MPSAALVKQLRDATGIGMMECKKALLECDGDLKKRVTGCVSKAAPKLKNYRSVPPPKANFLRRLGKNGGFA